MDLFTLFDQLLGCADSLTFKVEKVDGGKLRVITTPNLKAAPDNLSTELQELRASLALSLVITESAASLDSGFLERLQEYANARTSINSSMGTIESLKKTANKASKKAQGGKESNTKTKGKKSSTKSEAGSDAKPGNSAPPPTKPESVVQTDPNQSLF